MQATNICLVYKAQAVIKSMYTFVVIFLGNALTAITIINLEFKFLLY